MSGYSQARLSADMIADALGQHRPTAEQRAVIEAPAEPMLVVAGAGSGKTETMAGRVVWLVANGFVRPEEVLGLTFTRKGAGELAERITKRLRRLARSGLVPQEGEDDGTLVLEETPTVSTYNAYAGRIVTENGLRLGIEPDARLLSEGAAWQLAHDAVAHWDGDMSAVSLVESSVTAGVLSTAGELAEHLRTVDDLREYYDGLIAALDGMPYGKGKRSPGEVMGGLRKKAEMHRQLLPIISEYARLKAERSALDFSDQIGVAARLARRFPAIGAVERTRFKAVLLDEFQDTSEAQIAFLAALFATGEQRPAVTAVGDPHQSIFGWRGASASTLEKFRTIFARPGEAGTSVASLSTSWRNDHAVLDVANHVAQPLSATSRVPVARLTAGPMAESGVVQAARYETESEEAAAIAEWIAARRGVGGAGDPRSRALPPTAAVLCRRRSQFHAVLEALAEREIPAEAVGLGGLLLTPEVVDLVAMLWVVDDPGRGDHLMRLLTGPSLRLGAADIDGLGSWAAELHRRHREEAAALAGEELPGRSEADLAEATNDTVSIIEALSELPDPSWRGRDGERLSEAAIVRLRGFARSLDRLRALTGLPLADFVGEAERVLGLDIEVLARPGYDPSTARAHLDAFADVAATYSMQSERPTLGGFLDWLDAAHDRERGLERPAIEVNPAAVQVLTVHASKGLEWDLVAVPGLVEGGFPSIGGRMNGTPDGWVFSANAQNGWTTGVTDIPYALRGDVDGLPVYAWERAADRVELEEAHERFLTEGLDHALAEERRLAYVAFTRAKHAMLLTAAVWLPTAKAPRATSQFLLDLVEAGLVEKGPWAQMPEVPRDGENLTNPLDAEGNAARWPTDPLAAVREELRPGADLVAEARRRRAAQDGPGAPEALALPMPGTREDRDLEVELLLAERARDRRRSDRSIRLPAHLSASAVVALSDDPQAFARRLRRPMPAPPAVAARRGTAFHAWVEQHYQAAALVDIDSMPGAGDEDPSDDELLPVLKENFLASEWAARSPVEVEVDVETVIEGYAIRGRIDAVFPRPDGGFTIVDWKTGRQPSREVLRHRVLQLAAYAVAYARLNDVPPESVDGAFFYAADGRTLRPHLPGAAELGALLRGVTDEFDDGTRSEEAGAPSGR